MMTRKATTQDLEVKLKRALEEIKELKKDTSQLLHEQEENEAEFLKIMKQNTDLKSQLSELHAQHVEILDQRDQLLITIKTFDQCSVTYEQTLGRVHELEVDLRDANITIQQYEEDLRCNEVLNTQSLYEELIGSPATHVTSHTLQSNQVNKVIQFSAKNKLKKYCKINKYIRKTEKLIKRQKCRRSNIALRKERTDLLDSLEIYSKKLDTSRLKYDNDTRDLQADLMQLQGSLERMTVKYRSAQAQINEHILAATTFMKQCSCQAPAQPDRSLEDVEKQPSCKDNLTTPLLPHTSIKSNKNILSSINKDQNNVILISDEIGAGYGSLLKSHLSSSVMNYCSPNASLCHLYDKVKNCNYDESSIIVLMMGNGLRTCKKDILKDFSSILSLKVRKIILCALPYSKHYSQEQNNSIHVLNTLLFNLTCNHSDKLVFFDTNKFTNNMLILTGNSFYLPKKIKKKIATLLAFNIEHLYYKTLEQVPNNLNFILRQ